LTITKIALRALFSFLNRLILLFLFFLLFQISTAQDNLYTSYTTVQGRAKLYNNLLNNSIGKNLALQLTDSTEEKWEEAFWALELLQYSTPALEQKVTTAFDALSKRSDDFKRALLELAYANYPNKFNREITLEMNETLHPKVFVMCAEYLLRNNHHDTLYNLIHGLINSKFEYDLGNPLLVMLQRHIHSISSNRENLLSKKQFIQILDKEFLPQQVVMYSFQRKNRDYPGLVLVRQANGQFVRDSNNNIFAVPQLARSLSNLPVYITNGNTPQGIFKLKGFDVSVNTFIGPTPNIQMLMPVEDSVKHFFNDTTLTDTVWSVEKYEALLPKSVKGFEPLYESYYAGLAGRTEIIAHGTTINPEYYTGKTYYPHTPSLGCLCTKEIWNGKRMVSDQQNLVQAMLSAGGANGYCIVIELNNEQRPVLPEDIYPLLLKAKSSK
jgi:hypothetical protein